MKTTYTHVDEPIFCRSFSLLWIKRIYVGRAFDRLNTEARAAAIAHEHYHVDHHHTELRFLALVLLVPMLFIKRICHAQEFAADQYAARVGFRKGLLQLLATDSAESLMHPSHAARRDRLHSRDPRKGSIASLA